MPLRSRASCAPSGRDDGASFEYAARARSRQLFDRDVRGASLRRRRASTFNETTHRPERRDLAVLLRHSAKASPNRRAAASFWTFEGVAEWAGGARRGRSVSGWPRERGGGARSPARVAQRPVRAAAARADRLLTTLTGVRHTGLRLDFRRSMRESWRLGSALPPGFRGPSRGLRWLSQVLGIVESNQRVEPL